MIVIEAECPYCKVQATFAMLGGVNGYQCNCGKTVWTVALPNLTVAVLTDEQCRSACEASGMSYPPTDDAPSQNAPSTGALQ